MSTNYPTIPAVYDARNIAPRNVFKSGSPEFYPPGLATLDGTKSRDTGNTDVTVLRAGLLMGKATSGGKWRPSVIGLTAVLHDTSGVTVTMTLPAAVITEITRRVGATGTLKLIGPATTAGVVNLETVTYSAIASATTLTITATVNDFVAGSIVAAVDGTQYPTQVLTPNYGVETTDQSGTSQDALMRLVRSGDYDVTQIVNYSSMDTSVQAWVKASLRTTQPASTFSDDR